MDFHNKKTMQNKVEFQCFYIIDDAIEINWKKLNVNLSWLVFPQIEGQKKNSISIKKQDRLL